MQMYNTYNLSVSDKTFPKFRQMDNINYHIRLELYEMNISKYSDLFFANKRKQRQNIVKDKN